jgi:hypothetical protein
MKDHWGRGRAVAVCVALAIAAGAATAPPAVADRETVQDPDDSPGPLDIEQVYQAHYFEYVLYRVSTYERWDQTIFETGRLVFSFDTEGGPGIDRIATLRYSKRPRSDGGSLKLRIKDDKGKVVGHGVTRIPNGHTVEIWIKRGPLGKPNSYSMFVGSVFPGGADPCQSTCRDRAPETGRIDHELQPLCAHREPTISGTSDDDELHGTKGRDVIAGFGGDDTITGVRGGDVVCAGEGNDVIEGGRGFLFLDGGPGNDRISGTGPDPAPCDDVGGQAACAYPEALMEGGGGSDVLRGGSRHEALFGGGGNDSLYGEGSSDRLDGGPGEDILDGGDGADDCKHGEVEDSCES